MAAWRKGASGRNRNWFHKKGNQVGGSHSQQVALRSGKQLARKRVSNTRTAKLLNKQPCRCHHAGAFVLRGTATEAAPCFSFRIGVIQQRSGRAHRRPGCTGGQCTRGCVRDRVGLANGGNIAPTTRRCCQSMAASACRMISRSSFPDRELLVDFARYVLAERGAMCPAERRGGLSGAGGSSFPKSEAQQGARRGQRNRTQTGMI